MNKEIIKKIETLLVELKIDVNNDELLTLILESSDLKKLLDQLFKPYKKEKMISADLLDDIENEDVLTILDKYIEMNEYMIMTNTEVIIEDFSDVVPVDDVSAYLKEISKIPLYTPEQELEAFKELEQGDLSKKKEITEHNLRLVASIAKHYIYRNIAYLDLIQEGNLGLMKAVDKFDLNKGYKFSTYATWWVTQAITRTLANNSRTIRIPVHMHEKILKVNKVRNRLYNENGEYPTDEEVASLTGYTIEQVRKFISLDNLVVSLDTPVTEEEHGTFSTLLDYIPDKSEGATENLAMQSMLSKTIAEVLNGLTDKEKDIIMKRFGFIDGRARTLEEVGQEYNVTRERIRQIEAKTLKKLKRPSIKKKLQDFYE